MKEEAPERRPPSPRRAATFARSFRHAIDGVVYLFRSQRNARIHLVLAIVAAALGFWLRITQEQWAILVLTIALVLILEGLNTAIEAIVDLASPEFHPLAKTAKDVSAAVVLIAAVAAVFIGLLILGPPLWTKLAG